MSKQLKDYLHLYLGCEVEWLCISGEVGTLVGISESEVVPRTVAIIGGVVFQEWYVEDVKPLLRPLSDMTVEEATELESIGGGTVVFEKGTIVYSFDSDRTLWALKKGFDLFGLIDAGLAIDKTKQTQSYE